MRLIAVRHCQTEWNVLGKIQGITDNPLNAEGRRQAEYLADRLSTMRIDAIHCSDLCRAVDTAEAVARRRGLTVRPDPRLREFAFGTLEGLTFAQFTLRAGIRNASQWGDPLDCDLTAFGGETGRGVHARQLEVIGELRAAHPDGHVLIVGHSRSLRTLLVPLGVEAARRMKNGQAVIHDL